MLLLIIGFSLAVLVFFSHSLFQKEKQGRKTSISSDLQHLRIFTLEEGAFSLFLSNVLYKVNLFIHIVPFYRIF